MEEPGQQGVPVAYQREQDAVDMPGGQVVAEESFLLVVLSDADQEVKAKPLQLLREGLHPDPKVGILKQLLVPFRHHERDRACAALSQVARSFVHRETKGVHCLEHPGCLHLAHAAATVEDTRHRRSGYAGQMGYVHDVRSSLRFARSRAMGSSGRRTSAPRAQGCGHDP